jgi:hypothetical protein
MIDTRMQGTTKIYRENLQGKFTGQGNLLDGLIMAT